MDTAFMGLTSSRDVTVSRTLSARTSSRPTLFLPTNLAGRHALICRQCDPFGFESAFNALSAELDEPATRLINYQQRRQALQDWAIDETTWNDLISRLPLIPGPQRPELGDRKRQIASIDVWVQLTSREHHFAPKPIAAVAPPEIKQAWQLRFGTIWHLMQSPRPHYISLKAEIHTLATSLAQTIDTHPAEPLPPTTSGSRHL
jgi:hypothetical protein